jgi:uncharacterized protein (DUF2141 family)
MSVFDELKAKADANGDGKLTTEDLKSLEGKLPTEQLNGLKAKADANGDGKIDLSDLGGLKDLGGNLGSKLGDTLGGLKDKFLK